MKNKLISTCLVIVLTICAPMTVFAANTSGISITIDGNSVNFSDDLGYPFIDSASRTQVPFRVTMEACGYSVDWDSTTRTASVTDGSTTVQIPIGQSYILKNGSKIATDTAAQIVNGRTYLPIRAVLEAFSKDVSWNSATKTVEVVGDSEKTAANTDTSTPADEKPANTASTPADDSTVYYLTKKGKIHTEACYNDMISKGNTLYLAAKSTDINELLAKNANAVKCDCVTSPGTLCSTKQTGGSAVQADANTVIDTSSYYLTGKNEIHTGTCIRDLLDKGSTLYLKNSNSSLDALRSASSTATVCDCVTSGTLCSTKLSGGKAVQADANTVIDTSSYYVTGKNEIHTGTCIRDLLDKGNTLYLKNNDSSLDTLKSKYSGATVCDCVTSGTLCSTKLSGGKAVQADANTVIDTSSYYLTGKNEIHTGTCIRDLLDKGSTLYLKNSNSSLDALRSASSTATVCDCVTSGTLCSSKFKSKTNTSN